LNTQRIFLVLPSKKKPWYYVEKSKFTLKFFVEYLLTSRYKSLNAIIRFLGKIFLIDKLLLLFGHKTDELDNSIKPVFSSLKLANQKIIIRRTTWQRENDKFTVFIFNGSFEKPGSIAKCLSHQFSKSLETEFKNMKKVSRYFENTELSIPQPIKFFKSKTHAIYFEEFCNGIALNDLANRELSPGRRLNFYSQGLDSVDKLMSKFIEHKTGMPSEVYEKYVEDSLINFEKSSELVKHYPHRFNQLKDAAIKIKHKNLASTPMHGDLWGGSILMNGKQATVIDWEFFQEKGMPFWDFFMFLIHPGFVFKSKNKGLCSEFQAFLDHNKGSNKTNQILQNHAAKLNINNEDIEFLFQTFLIYNCLTRDNATERNWEKCLTYYWGNEPLFSEDQYRFYL